MNGLRRKFNKEQTISPLELRMNRDEDLSQGPD